MIKFHIRLLRFLKDKRTWCNASPFLVDFYKGDEPLKWRVHQVILDSIASGYIETSDHNPNELSDFINRSGTTPGLLNLRIKIAGEHELDRLEGWKIFTKQNLITGLGAIFIALLSVIAAYYVGFLPNPSMPNNPVNNVDSSYCNPTTK